MTDNTNPQDLIALLRTFIGDTQIVRAAREAADVIEQQAAHIAELERKVSGERGQKEIWEVRAKEWCERATANSAMAKDAERYRWLREASYDAAMPVMFDYNGPTPMVYLRRATIQLDRAIDAAIAASELKTTGE